MRDSLFKQFLVSAYFSAREVFAAASGMFNQPEFRVGSANYDEYWQHRAPSRIHPRFQIIARHLRSGDSVLDVGCGDGAMLEYFAKTKGTHGVGLDISAVAVEHARKRSVDARVQKLVDFSSEVGQVSFDHVVISEVLEHLLDSEDFVTRGWKLAGKTLW